MKNKTLFSIRLPAVNKSFDLWIPNELSIYEATKLVQTLLEEREARHFKASASVSLYLESESEELEVDKLIGEYDFVDGTKLVLI